MLVLLSHASRPGTWSANLACFGKMYPGFSPLLLTMKQNCKLCCWSREKSNSIGSTKTTKRKVQWKILYVKRQRSITRRKHWLQRGKAISSRLTAPSQKFWNTNGQTNGKDSFTTFARQCYRNLFTLRTISTFSRLFLSKFSTKGKDSPPRKSKPSNTTWSSGTTSLSSKMYSKLTWKGSAPARSLPTLLRHYKASYNGSRHIIFTMGTLLTMSSP